MQPVESTPQPSGSGQPAKSSGAGRSRLRRVSFCATGGVIETGYGLECSQFCVEESGEVRFGEQAPLYRFIVDPVGSDNWGGSPCPP